MTVGPGITPGLLTLAIRRTGLDRRSRARRIARHYRRWGLAPRPENVNRGRYSIDRVWRFTTGRRKSEASY